MNSVRALFRSRKFLLLLVDAVISTITLAVGLWAKASLPTVLAIIGIYQPVFIAVIGGIAYEDGQAKRSGTHPKFQ